MPSSWSVDFTQVHRSIVLMQNEPQASKIWKLVSNGSLKWDPNEMCIVLILAGTI